MMSLMNSSETSQDTAMTAPNSAMKITVPVSKTGARLAAVRGRSCSKVFDSLEIIILRFDKP